MFQSPSSAFHIGVDPVAVDNRSQIGSTLDTVCSQDTSNELYEVFSSGTKNSDAPFVIEVTIDKMLVNMELDTGEWTC